MRQPASARRTSAVRVALFNLLVVGAVAVYLARGGPLAPDYGLQQLDILTLRERVAGVAAEGGRPTLVLLAGRQDVPACRTELAALAGRRGSADGLPGRVGLVVVTPDGAGPAVPDARYVADPGGELARRLALPRAAGCAPGYAVVDATGFVRYRSYDPRYGAHAFEQLVLLDATR